MSRPPKLRVQIDVEGKARELFSARITRNEDLILVFKYSNFHNDEEMTKTLITEQRYSVHPSKQSVSKLNTIKHTLILENGDTFNSYHETFAIRDNLLAPLIFRLCPALNEPEYVSNPRAKDEVSMIDAYDVHEKTLMYTILLTSNNGPNIVPKSSRYKQISYDFGPYRIILVWSFSNLYSHYRGQISHNMNMTPRENGEISNHGVKIPPTPGVRHSRIHTVIFSEFTRMHEFACDLMHSTVPEIPADIFKAAGFGLFSKEEFIVRAVRKNIG